jgi:hypothetical protein
MRAIELIEDQDDNGFEFKSRTQSPTHHLLLQGPSSEHSSLIVVAPRVANPQLLPILELDTHLDVSYVLDEFCESYFEDLVN